MARTKTNAEKKLSVISEIKSRIRQAPEPVLLGSFFEELNKGAWLNIYDFVRVTGQVLKEDGFFIKSITGHGTFAFHQDFEIPQITITRVSCKRLMTPKEIDNLYEGICNTAIETGATLSMTDFYNERGKEAFDHPGHFVAAFKRWLNKRQKGGKYPELIFEGKKVLGSFLGTNRAEIESYLTVPERKEILSREEAAADKQEIAERIIVHVLEVNGIVDMTSLFKQEKFTHVNGRAVSTCEKWWRIMFTKMLATDARIVMLQRRGKGPFLAPEGVDIEQELEPVKASTEPRKRGRHEGVRYAWRQTEEGIISYNGMRSTPNFNGPEWEKLASVPVFLQRAARDVEAVYMMYLPENKSKYATLCSNGDIYIYSPK